MEVKVRMGKYIPQFYVDDYSNTCKVTLKGMGNKKD